MACRLYLNKAIKKWGAPQALIFLKFTKKLHQKKSIFSGMVLMSSH